MKKIIGLTLAVTLAFTAFSVPAQAVNFVADAVIGTGRVASLENRTLDADCGVTYAKASYTDADGDSQAVYALEFNPKNGCMPQVYSKYTGTGRNAYETAVTAEEKYGADVIAITNASYYTGATGSTYAGYWVHDGALAQASIDYRSDIMTFDGDGNFNIVQSQLDFRLYLNENEILYNGASPIVHVNKKCIKGSVDNRIYYYDAECGSVADTYETDKGLELRCKKLNSGILSIGGVLFAEVLEVRRDSYGCSVGIDEFVLFLKNDSPLQDKLTDIKAGDRIELAVNETISESAPYTESAITALVAQYKIVENGEYCSDAYDVLSSTVGGNRQTTSIGIKADGSVVIACTAGRYTTDNAPGLTFTEQAQVMMQLGCVTAYNLDGGGSTQMLIKNDEGEFEYALKSNEGTYGRNVANCLMIVKKNGSTADLATFAEGYEGSDEKAIIDAILAIDTLASKSVCSHGEVNKARSALTLALKAKELLSADIKKTDDTVTFEDYSGMVLKDIWGYYQSGKALLSDKQATAKAVYGNVSDIRRALLFTGDASINISYGKSYKAPAPQRNDGWDDDGSQLTDGSYGNPSGDSYTYCGWNVNKTGTGNLQVIIDLDKTYDSIAKFSAYCAYNIGWGISEPISAVFSVSDDGEKFKDVLTVKASQAIKTAGSPWNLVLFEGTTEAVTGRYIKVIINAYSFVWIDEIGVFTMDTAGYPGYSLDGINRLPEGTEATLLTPDYKGGITADYPVAYFKKDDDGKYKCNGYTFSDELADYDAALVYAPGMTFAIFGEVLYITEFFGVDFENSVLLPGAYYVTEIISPPALRGDIDGNGSVEARDYLILKRIVLGSFAPTDEMKLASDVNRADGVTALDYIMLKRVILGTYVFVD